EILQYLPDLTWDMNRYGVGVPVSRVDYMTEQNEVQRRHIWNLHGAGSRTEFEAILEKFKSPAASWNLWEVQLHPKGDAGTVVLTAPKGVAYDLEFPSMRESMDCAQMAYARDLSTREIVDAYVAGYGLSMLARYFPDLWIACLESHCLAAQL